jgi:hypothetical protein
MRDNTFKNNNPTGMGDTGDMGSNQGTGTSNPTSGGGAQQPQDNYSDIGEKGGEQGYEEESDTGTGIPAEDQGTV